MRFQQQPFILHYRARSSQQSSIAPVVLSRRIRYVALPTHCNSNIFFYRHQAKNATTLTIRNARNKPTWRVPGTAESANRRKKVRVSPLTDPLTGTITASSLSPGKKCYDLDYAKCEKQTDLACSWDSGKCNPKKGFHSFLMLSQHPRRYTLTKTS